MPRTSTCPSVIETGDSEILPGSSQKTPMVAITTRLLTTGAQAGGLKICLACKIAPISALRP